jgi:hypothetical protein
VNIIFLVTGPLDKVGQCVSIAADSTRDKMVDGASGRSNINLQFWSSRVCYRNNSE